MVLCIKRSELTLETRNKAIKQVTNLLNEDITDQFHINEVDAALEGDTIFTIENSRGEQVTLQNIFLKNSETLDYKIVFGRLLVIPPTHIIHNTCSHPFIEKKLHETKYTCLKCGLVADVNYFRNKKEQ